VSKFQVLKLGKANSTPRVWTPIERRRGELRTSGSVSEVQPRKSETATIDREDAVAGARVSVLVGSRSVCSVEKRVMVNHVVAHVVGPFEDLGADVDHEGVG
jgi:hypothetical protein